MIEKSKEEFDLVAHLKHIFTGMLNPGIVSELRELNFIYFLEKSVVLADFQPIIVEMENAFNTDKSLPTLHYLSTKFPEHMELFNSISAFNPKFISKHTEFCKVVDKYHGFYLKNHYHQTLLEAADKAKDSLDAANKHLEDNLLVQNRKIEYLDEIDLERIYTEDFSKARIFCPYIKTLDKMIGSFVSNSLLLTNGFTGHGKTQLALNMFYTSTVIQGFVHVFLSYEMTKNELFFRLLCRHSMHEKFEDTRVPFILNDILKNRLSPEQHRFVFKEVWPDLRSHSNMIVLDVNDFNTLTPFELLSRLLLIKNKLGIIHALTVDYIQMLARIADPVDPSKQNQNITQITADWSRWFQQQTKTFDGGRGIFVNLLSQIKDESWKEAVKNHGKYTPGCSSTSSETEKGADYMITVFSDEDLKANSSTKMQLLKHRHGADIPEPFEVCFKPELAYLGDFKTETDDEEVSLEALGFMV